MEIHSKCFCINEWRFCWKFHKILKNGTLIKKGKNIIKNGEEEDKKAKLNLEILKNYQKKETKSVKKIFITLFLIFALTYIVKLLMG